MDKSRPYDIIVYGASGFTGQFVTQFLLKKGMVNFAIGGRSENKLREALKGSNIPILVADVFDKEGLKMLVKQTNVLINCVGPFRLYGEPVFEACLDMGTNYVDITGEPEFIERMMLKYHQIAKEKKLLMVSACGFDSVPTEMGLLFVKKEFIKQNVIPSSVEMFFRIHTGDSGIVGNSATFESLVEGIYSRNELQILRKKANFSKISYVGPKLKFHKYPHYDPRIGAYTIPFVFADPSVVRLSQDLTEKGKNDPNILDLPPVQFTAYLHVPTIFHVIVQALYFVFLFFMCSFRFTKNLMIKYTDLVSFGFFSINGPSLKQMQETSFTTTFIAKGFKHAKHNENPDYDLEVKVRGPEMGYITTPICVVNCAMKIVENKKSLPCGVLTPSVAFSNTDIIERLCADGMEFTVVNK